MECDNKIEKIDFCKWRWVLVFLIVFLIVLICPPLLAGKLSLVISGMVAPDEFQPGSPVENVNGFLLPVKNICTLFVTLVFFFFIGKLIKWRNIDLNTEEYLGRKTVDLKTLGIWLGLHSVLLVCIYATSYFMGKPLAPEFVIQVIQTINSTPLLIFGIAIAPPIYEELVFRGLLFYILSQFFTCAGAWIGLGRFGAWIVIFIISLVFACIHTQYEFHVKSFLFFEFMLIGMARWKTGSILLPMILHSLTSLVALAVGSFSISSQYL
jgi:membrane protease YdiL (CAAX protease family)